MTKDIVLKKKTYIEGLTKEEILFLLEFLEEELEIFPIELEDAESECSAIGFISVDAASSLNYDYDGSGLRDFVNVAMKCGGTEFNFNGISVYISK